MWCCNRRPGLRVSASMAGLPQPISQGVGVKRKQGGEYPSEHPLRVGHQLLYVSEPFDFVGIAEVFALAWIFARTRSLRIP